MQSVSGRRIRRAAALVILVTLFSGEATAVSRPATEREAGERLTRRFIEFVVTVFSRIGTPPGGG